MELRKSSNSTKKILNQDFKHFSINDILFISDFEFISSEFHKGETSESFNHLLEIFKSLKPKLIVFMGDIFSTTYAKSYMHSSHHFQKYYDLKVYKKKNQKKEILDEHIEDLEREFDFHKGFVEFIDRLSKFKTPIIWYRGNHDYNVKDYIDSTFIPNRDVINEMIHFPDDYEIIQLKDSNLFGFNLKEDSERLDYLYKYLHLEIEEEALHKFLLDNDFIFCSHLPSKLTHKNRGSIVVDEFLKKYDVKSMVSGHASGKYSLQDYNINFLNSTFENKKYPSKNQFKLGFDVSNNNKLLNNFF
ncbi:MAG: metallophosphoesterase [Candidatus Woesearchaeota archaeon]|jgi:Icc-related predicted phosphoesterase|nr:metallophosphoesterase [Candidatus Woesearchaeota archaeon]